MTPDKMDDEFYKKMAEQSLLMEPGSVMFLIIHTGEDGMIPPPLDAPEGVEGKGDAHSFGPFVSKEEAEAWQSAMDDMNGECECRKAVVPMAVPRLMGIIGPPAIPMDVAVFMVEGHDKDRLN
jgi:hypothetical protein